MPQKPTQGTKKIVMGRALLPQRAGTPSTTMIVPARTSLLRSAVFAIAAIAIAGCYGLVSDDGTSGNGGNGGNGGPSDVPCDVASVLASKCNSCHGSPPASGVPVSFTSAA